jgi:hypothetical protein
MTARQHPIGLIRLAVQRTQQTPGREKGSLNPDLYRRSGHSSA